MDDSYVPLFRSILDHRYMRDPVKFTFWVWCLLRANYKPRKVLVGNTTIDLEVGQFIYGRKKASEELNMSERTLRTLTNFFSEKEQKVTIKTTNKFSIITVIDYASYMDKINRNDQQNDQQVTSKRPANDQQVTTDNKVKKVKKETKPLSPDALRLSDRLAKSILRNNPTHSKLSNGKYQDCVNLWAKPIDMMLKEKVAPSRIEQVIDWCQRDNFWKGNILSGDTLRKQFDSLAAKMTTAKPSGNDRDVFDFGSYA